MSPAFTYFQITRLTKNEQKALQKKTGDRSTDAYANLMSMERCNDGLVDGRTDEQTK